ncbi:RDD family protein [Massilia sp. DWR3-1-1]|uniref:RDD family protein n=1 Tax=Massilia sp. DWR3-1-1 TaxID=2804559 RepID=UPI003CF67699
MIGQWYFASLGKQTGPLDLAEMRRLYANGSMDDASLAWRPGMAEWQRVADIDELAGLVDPAQSTQGSAQPLSMPVPAVPPPLPPTHAGMAAARPGWAHVAQATNTVEASNPWRRFFARMVDTWILTFAAGAIIGIPCIIFVPGFAEWLEQPGADTLLSWISTPFALLAEAIVFGIFGSTIGKALLGVRVRTLGGEVPGFGAYLRRMPGVWWYGLGTGLPLITLFTCMSGYRCLGRGEPMAYDEGEFTVTASDMGSARTVVTVVVVALVFASMGWAAL